MLTLAPGARAVTQGPSYSVQVNTGALSGQSGFFFLSFNKGNISNSLNATAAITNFLLGPGATFTAGTTTTDGAVTPSPLTTLTSPFSIANTQSPNDVLQGLTFGSNFSFNVSFSGPAFDPTQVSSFGSDFTVGLADTMGDPLLTSDPDGTVLDIKVNPNAGVGGSTFPNVVPVPYPTATGAPTVVTYKLLPPGGGGGGGTTVPEPGSLGLLLAGGLLGLAAGGRRVVACRRLAA